MLQEVVALGLVIVAAVFVADGTDRHGLNQRVARQEVEDLPRDPGGPEEVARVRLAPVEQRSLGLDGLILITELEQGDVGEVEVSELGEDVVGQLEPLRVGGVNDELAGGADVGFVGGFGRGYGCQSKRTKGATNVTTGRESGKERGRRDGCYSPTSLPSTTTVWAETREASGSALARSSARAKEAILVDVQNKRLSFWRIGKLNEGLATWE